jgi:hypothetical protein
MGKEIPINDLHFMRRVIVVLILSWNLSIIKI